MKAEKCPVCYGSGKYPSLTNKNVFLISKNEKEIKPEDQKECHGCMGKGWICVPSDSPPYFPPRHFYDKIRRQTPLKGYTRL